MPPRSCGPPCSAGSAFGGGPSKRGMVPPSSDVRNRPQSSIHERCKSIDERLKSLGSDVLLCCTRGVSGVGPSKANRQTIASLTGARPHARHVALAHRASGARIDRLPVRRRAAGDAEAFGREARRAARRRGGRRSGLSPRPYAHPAASAGLSRQVLGHYVERLPAIFAVPASRIAGINGTRNVERGQTI